MSISSKAAFHLSMCLSFHLSMAVISSSMSICPRRLSNNSMLDPGSEFGMGTSMWSGSSDGGSTNLWQVVHQGWPLQRAISLRHAWHKRLPPLFFPYRNSAALPLDHSLPRLSAPAAGDVSARRACDTSRCSWHIWQMLSLYVDDCHPPKSLCLPHTMWVADSQSLHMKSGSRRVPFGDSLLSCRQIGHGPSPISSEL